MTAFSVLRLLAFETVIILLLLTCQQEAATWQLFE